MVKILPANSGDPGSIPGLGRSPREGSGYPLQYSFLENPVDRGSWQATVPGVAKSWLYKISLHAMCQGYKSGIIQASGNSNPLQYPCLEKSHGQRSLVGYSPWGRKESDTTEGLHFNSHWFVHVCVVIANFPKLFQFCCHWIQTPNSLRNKFCVKK